jgi:hypothetical protein
MAIGSSVGNSPIATTPTYCQVADVYEVLQKAMPSEHSDEGEPTLSMVKRRILAVENQIDRACNTSWRPRRELLEYHDFQTFFDEEFWILIGLKNKPVLPLSAVDGDALEVRQGGVWVDYLSQFTQGPNGQFWIEEPAGFLRLRRGPFEYTDQARVRVSYRYGNVNPPADIAEACAMLVAARLSSGDLVSIGGRGGESDRLAMDPRISQWKRDAYAIMAQYVHWGGS